MIRILGPIAVILAGAWGLFASAAPAQETDPSSCERPKPRTEVLTEAASRGMVRVASARLPDGKLLEVLAHLTGRFQAVVSTPDGLTCPSFHGEAWYPIILGERSGL